jgi:hypothetical protein
MMIHVLYVYWYYGKRDNFLQVKKLMKRPRITSKGKGYVLNESGQLILKSREPWEGKKT